MANYISWDNWVQLSTLKQYEWYQELYEENSNLQDLIDDGKDSFLKDQARADTNSEL